MHWNNNKIILIVFSLFAFVGLSILKQNGKDGVWRVIGEIPPSINREKGIDTSTYYIIKQTHEPLFRCDDLQNYTSKILSSWSRSVDYKKFTFCPGTSLKFNKTKYLTRALFDEYLSSITIRYGAEFKLSRAADCDTVEFKIPQKKYLYFLTWYENAPAVKLDGIEYGLGEFYVLSYSEDIIIFDRKKHVKNGYNKIIYYKYAGENDPNLQNEKIQDFNLLSSFQQPEWIKKEYVGIKSPDPRTIVLLINHPDKRIRKKLYNCIDVQKFRKAFVVKRKEFYDVKTVLPVGISGAKSGLPEQFCDSGGHKLKDTEDITLINQRDDNNTALTEYVDNLHKQTGIKIVVKKIGYQELVKLLKNAKRKPFSYVLLQIVLDTFRPDHKVFFEYTSGSRSFLDTHVPETEKLFSELLKAEEFDAQRKIAEDLADKLGQEALVLPLYQTYSIIYYPKGIKNMILGKSFTQYPDVADLRW